MSCPEQDYAQVGDTIEITCDQTPLFERQLVVVAPPERETHLEHKTGDAWVWDTTIPEFPELLGFRHDHYILIKKVSEEQTRSIDDFLRKQLHDNLGSIFC